MLKIQELMKIMIQVLKGLSLNNTKGSRLFFAPTLINYFHLSVNIVVNGIYGREESNEIFTKRMQILLKKNFTGEIWVILFAKECLPFYEYHSS